jgi:hypothetical protein
MEASNQWATRPEDQRFETLTALRESVANRRLRSRSVDIDLSKVKAENTGGTILINSGLAAVEPSHWSFGQLSGWLKAPAEYIRRLPAPLAVQNLNHGLSAVAQERGALKFMTVARPDDSQGFNTLQAVTSTTYGRIWDADCVDCASRIQERFPRFHNPLAYSKGFGSAPRPSGLYASDHDCFIFMIDGGSLLEAGPRAQLNRGFIMSNSETGARTFTLKTFLFNQVCGNHIIWGAREIKEVSIRHTANGPYRFDSEAAPGLLAYVNASAAPELSALKRAQDFLLPSTKEEEIVSWLRSKGKFSNDEAKSAIASAKSEEGDCRTLWHVVQGLTAYARGFDFIDSRTDLETRAGKLLELVNRAA